MDLASSTFNILESGVMQTQKIVHAWESLHPNLTQLINQPHW